MIIATSPVCVIKVNDDLYELASPLVNADGGGWYDKVDAQEILNNLGIDLQL